MQFQDQIQEDFNNWLDETEGKFDIDSFFFEYFDNFHIEVNGNKTKKMENALKRAKFFSPFAFKPQDKDHSTFWNYISEIGNEYLDHCSSEDIMLLADQHININAPEDIGYIIFRQEYDYPLESEFYNSKTDSLAVPFTSRSVLNETSSSYCNSDRVTIKALQKGLEELKHNGFIDYALKNNHSLTKPTTSTTLHLLSEYAEHKQAQALKRNKDKLREIKLQKAQDKIHKLQRRAHVAGEFGDLQEEERCFQAIDKELDGLETTRLKSGAIIDVGRIYRMSPGEELKSNFQPEDMPF